MILLSSQALKDLKLSLPNLWLSTIYRKRERERKVLLKSQTFASPFPRQNYILSLNLMCVIVKNYMPITKWLSSPTYLSLHIKQRKQAWLQSQ